MPSLNKQIGAQGESLAQQFLQSQGMQILSRNVMLPGGELDLVALDSGGDLVFVEVKTDRFESFSSPALRVDVRKQRQIAKLAQIYLQRFGLPSFKRIRFDVCAVVLENAQVLHYKDAFVPMLN